MDFGPFHIDLTKAATLGLAALYFTDLAKRFWPFLAGRWVQGFAFGIALLLSVLEVAFAEEIPVGRDLAWALGNAVCYAIVAVVGADLRNRLDRRDDSPSQDAPPDKQDGG